MVISWIHGQGTAAFRPPILDHTGSNRHHTATRFAPGRYIRSEGFRIAIAAWCYGQHGI